MENSWDLVFYSDFGCCVVRPVRLDRSVKAFVDFIGFSPARWNSLLRKNFTLRFSQTLSVGRSEKHDDTRQNSDGLQTRTPETNRCRNNLTIRLGDKFYFYL